MALGGLGNGLPPRLVFDFRIGEELAGLRMEEDRVVVNSVFFQNGLQIRPDRTVAVFVLFLLDGVHRHNKRFTGHWDCPDVEKIREQIQ